MRPLYWLRSTFGSSASPLPAALAVTAVFVVLALVEIELPGLYMDEAIIDSYDVGLIDSSKADRPVFRLPDNMLDKHNRFPILAGCLYTGLPATYIGAPYYAVFGMNVASLRIYHALYGVATVFFAFLIMDRFAGRFAATCGGFLLAVDAAFVISFREQGWAAFIGVAFLLTAILLALNAKEPSRPVSARRAFAIGLLYGIACYSYFVFFLFAIPLAVLLFCFARRRLSVANVSCCLGGCLLGYSPIFFALLSIAHTNPGVFQESWNQAGRDGTIWSQGLHVLGRLSATLRNTGMPELMAGWHPLPFLDAKLWFWLALAIVGPIVAWRSRHRPARILFALGAGAAVCYWLQLLAFNKQIQVHHLAPTLPFLYMALAALIAAVRMRFRPAAVAGFGRWPLRAVSGLALAVVLCVAGMNVAQYFATMHQLRATGGVGFFSDAVNFLARDLQMYHAKDKVVFCSWGYMTSCHFLSRGDIDYAFDLGGPDERAHMLKWLFSLKPSLTFVFPVESGTPPKDSPRTVIHDLVYKIAAEEHFVQQTVEVFSQRDGVPIIEAIRFAKAAP